jgi:hypothetical protein
MTHDQHAATLPGTDLSHGIGSIPARMNRDLANRNRHHLWKEDDHWWHHRLAETLIRLVSSVTWL